jgi:WD40 repeat protein
LRSADLEKIRAEFRDYPYPNLMRAIEVSTDNLNEDEKRLYLDLAVFPEDEQLPEEALQVIWNRDQYDTQDLIDLFVDRSLATLKNGRLSVHNLQHDFMIKRAGKLQDLHDKLLEGYRIRCQNGWPSGPNDGYFFQHLAYHLSQAGRKNELKALLQDLDWMQAKLWAMDVSSLLSDYDQISSEEDLSLVQGAIRLSAHVLFRDPRQLPGQLTGRLLGMEMPSIQSMIEEMPSKISYPWIRPINGSLTPPGGPLIRTFTGHAGWVNSVAISADGRRALSGSYDKTLKLWDIETRREIRSFLGHAGGVNSVAISADGRRALSGSYDKTLKLWDIETGREIRSFPCHADRVRSVAISADGRRALSGSDDNTLKLWDIETGKMLAEFSGDGPITAVALAGDGWTIVAGEVSGRVHFLKLENA